jgi:hypothetical protein
LLTYFLLQLEQQHFMLLAEAFFALGFLTVFFFAFGAGRFFAFFAMIPSLRMGLYLSHTCFAPFL